MNLGVKPQPLTKKNANLSAEKQVFTKQGDHEKVRKKFRKKREYKKDYNICQMLKEKAR